MKSETSLQLYELTQEFIQDKEKAKIFVSKIEKVVAERFENYKGIFLTKEDKVDLIRTIYIVNLVQFLAIIGSVVAIVNFMLK